MNKHLILIGFMGTGKSSVGAQVAQLLNMPFIDTDQLFEERYGLIRDYFHRYGEEVFRARESQLLQEILKLPAHVIATGGGSVLRPVNKVWMQRYGYVVRLEADLDIITKRLNPSKQIKDRPLVHNIDKLFIKRATEYDFADFSIDTGSLNIYPVVQAIGRAYSCQVKNG